ncbi:MAG: hypothetical protein JKY52_12895 [Flavobacteriales bacterium]|nr:hypothetical protein [Flavobacteriales bacterium]
MNFNEAKNTRSSSLLMIIFALTVAFVFLLLHNGLFAHDTIGTDTTNPGFDGVAKLTTGGQGMLTSGSPVTLKKVASSLETGRMSSHFTANVYNYSHDGTREVINAGEGGRFSLARPTETNHFNGSKLSTELTPCTPVHLAYRSKVTSMVRGLIFRTDSNSTLQNEKRPHTGQANSTWSN